TATIDRKVKITVSEGSIRRHLKLEDSKGISSLLTAEIFEQLALMGYVTTFDSLTFQKGHHCLSPKKTAWEQFSSNTATAIICLATNRTFNFSKFIFDAMVKNLDSIHMFFINMKRVSKGYSGVITPLFNTMLVQPQGVEPSIQTTPETSPCKITSSPSLSSHHTSISVLSTSQPPITPTEEAAPMPYESPLHSVHSLGRDEGSMQQHELMDLVTKLTDRIEVLEKDLQQTKKTYSTALTTLILRVKKLEKNVKTCKARRRARIVISEDEDVAEDSSKQRRKISDIDTDPIISLVQPQQDMEYDFDATASIPITTAGLEISIANIAVSTADATVTTASASISTVSPPRVSTAEDISGAETLVYIRRSASKKLDEREEVVAKESHDIDWSDHSVLRYHALQNRPLSVAEVRKNICMYLKNQGGYKMSHFKGMSYEERRPIFERVWDQIQSFIPMDSEKEKDSEKKTRGRRKKSLARKRARETLSEEKKESLDVESLATKYPIVEWETQILANDKYYYQIKRADGSVKHYKIFSAMLYDFDRQDVLELYRLVKDRFQTASLEGYV
ncbi:hypothetical protein Tco_0687231, partial [Tanacetum coccineum]